MLYEIYLTNLIKKSFHNNSFQFDSFDMNYNGVKKDNEKTNL